MPKQRSFTIEEFIAAVAKSQSKAGVLRELNLIPAGGNYATVNKYIKELGLDTSHFHGQGWRKGSTTPVRAARPLSSILVRDCFFSISHLKKRLLREKVLHPVCSKCFRTEWNNLPIPLELDHINGVSTDHRLENLRLLCPNCHAQTPTHRGRNKKTSLRGAKGWDNPHSTFRPKRVDPMCLDCGKQISRKSVRCKSCAATEANQTKIDWPSSAVLRKRVDKSSYRAVAKELGVSDNAVRKRLARHS